MPALDVATPIPLTQNTEDAVHNLLCFQAGAAASVRDDMGGNSNSATLFDDKPSVTTNATGNGILKCTGNEGSLGSFSGNNEPCKQVHFDNAQPWQQVKQQQAQANYEQD